MTKMTVLYAVFVAVLFVVLMRRHTRVEEESGRNRAVVAGAVGRCAARGGAPRGRVGGRAPGMPGGRRQPGLRPRRLGSLAFGAVWAGTAMVASGIAAVAAAVGECPDLRCVRGRHHRRPVRAARHRRHRAAVGWLTPLGSNTQARAYADPRWWCSCCIRCSLLRLRSRHGPPQAAGSRVRPGGLLPGPERGSSRPADVSPSPSRCTRPRSCSGRPPSATGRGFGMIAPGIGDLLDSAIAKDIVDRRCARRSDPLGGGCRPHLLRDGGRRSAGSDEAAGARRWSSPLRRRTGWLGATLPVALVGTAWLLVVTGVGLESGTSPPPARRRQPGRRGARLGTRRVGRGAPGRPRVVLRPDGPPWSGPGRSVPGPHLGRRSRRAARVGDDVSPYSHVPQVPAERWTGVPMADSRGCCSPAGCGVVAIPQARHRLVSRSCGSRSRTGWRSRVAPVRGPSGRGGRRSGASGRDQAPGAPQPGDPAVLGEPGHIGYWRREADVLFTGLANATPGCAARPDRWRRTEGITIVRDWVEDAASSGLFLAMWMGRFAGAHLPRPRFLAHNLMRDRLDRVATGAVADLGADDGRGRGRPSLAHRATMLTCSRAAAGPAAWRSDGANLPGRTGDDAMAIDWGTVGTGPVGGDLGYLSLSASEGFEPLLDAYLLGLPDADHDEVVLGDRSWPSTPRSAVPSGHWPVSPGERAPLPPNTATPRSPPTSARCSGSSRTSKRCSSSDLGLRTSVLGPSVGSGIRSRSRRVVDEILGPDGFESRAAHAGSTTCGSPTGRCG